MRNSEAGTDGRGATTLGTRLDNGLTVLVRRVPDADVAAVVTRVDAGYFDEPDDAVGISHVLEHMYFKGTGRRGPGDIGREIRAAGGYINAGTIYDRTSYYAVVPADALSRALDVHADALCNLRIDADELAREIRVIIEEVKRKRDTPAAVVQEALYAAMFDRHRMRRWRMGTEEELARFDEHAVRAFHASRYRPGNVVVSIAGGVDTEAVLAEAERLFTGMPAAPAQRDRGPAEPERREFRLRELSGAIHRTYLQWGWRTQGPLHADTPALDLLSVVLGQGRASRLYREVRETGRVQEIGASHYTPTELGVFSIGAVAEPVEADAALEAVADAVVRLRSAPASSAEVTRARRIVEARLMRRFETVEAQANLMADWQALGDWRLLDDYTARLLAVSAKELEATAARYLDFDRATILVYRPDASPSVSWRAAGAPVPIAARPPASAPRVTGRPRRRRAARIEDGVHVYERDGSTVLVQPRATAPLVSLAFAFGAGVTEEPPGRPGATSLMARTALKGTATRDAATLAEQVEGLGGIVGGAVGADAFEWTLELPARHLAEGLELLADAVWRPAFAPAELEIERKALLGELARVRDDMYGYPLRLMLEAAFAEHRYGASLEAHERAARALDASGLEAWHARTVLARPVLALVVGDVDADDAAARVLPYLRLPRPTPAPAPPPFARRDGPGVRVVPRQTAQTALVLGFPAPPRNHADADALQLLAAAVGGLGGRLFEELRSRRSLAYTVSASPILRAAAGVFACYIATTPEREDEARTAMADEIARLAVERLPDADVERARRFLIGSRRIRRQTHAARLAELAGAFLLGRGMAEIRDHEGRILALGPEQVRAAAETWLGGGPVAEGIVRGTRSGGS